MYIYIHIYIHIYIYIHMYIYINMVMVLKKCSPCYWRVKILWSPALLEDLRRRDLQLDLVEHLGMASNACERHPGETPNTVMVGGLWQVTILIIVCIYNM